LNYFSEYLGCDIKNDPGCLEFENNSVCQETCWKSGGSEEIDKMCKFKFTDQNSCNAMKYFCKWDTFKHSCGAVKDDPWTLFTNNAPQSAGAPKAIFSENVNGYTLNCAQSSWSSTDVTSYAPTVRTCCINSRTNKACITTPRCQFVETTCECGFKDIDPLKNPSYTATNSINDPNSVKQPWFICEDTQQSVIVNKNIFTKKGYCTWCKGTQLKDFDYREWLINNQLGQGEDIRYSNAWGTTDNCSNRCSNYNKCENNNSETLWNECIWRNSEGAFGVDPSIGDLSKGFCYSDNCLENATTQAEKDKCNTLGNLKNVCENELANVVSTKNQLYPITTNGGIPTERCTEGTSWNHSCLQLNGTVHAENYACGWCPNLQNDWSDNPCPTAAPTIIPTIVPQSNWFSPLSVFGVTDQTSGGIAIFLILLISVLLIVGFALFGEWVWKKGHL
jgi:hypothetical protein